MSLYTGRPESAEKPAPAHTRRKSASSSASAALWCASSSLADRLAAAFDVPVSWPLALLLSPPRDGGGAPTAAAAASAGTLLLAAALARAARRSFDAIDGPSAAGLRGIAQPPPTSLLLELYSFSAAPQPAFCICGAEWLRRLPGHGKALPP